LGDSVSSIFFRVGLFDWASDGLRVAVRPSDRASTWDVLCSGLRGVVASAGTVGALFLRGRCPDVTGLVDSIITRERFSGL
jgi:hypothetical protein